MNAVLVAWSVGVFAAMGTAHWHRAHVQARLDLWTMLALFLASWIGVAVLAWDVWLVRPKRVR